MQSSFNSQFGCFIIIIIIVMPARPSAGFTVTTATRSQQSSESSSLYRDEKKHRRGAGRAPTPTQIQRPKKPRLKTKAADSFRHQPSAVPGWDGVTMATGVQGRESRRSCSIQQNPPVPVMPKVDEFYHIYYFPLCTFKLCKKLI